MMQLLRDLLEYSQVNKTDYSSEIVSLEKMSADVIFLLGAEKAFICNATDSTIEIPHKPFEIVLRNLMSNAIKHHDKESGTITIKYSCDDFGHRLVVEDDGPGIPDNLQAKAMEMFQTLQPRDKTEGSGMGLAMVVRIIEHHGGSFNIEKGRKTGTCCIISWPFVDSDNAII